MLLTAAWSIIVLLYTHNKRVTRSVFEIKFSSRLLKALDFSLYWSDLGHRRQRKTSDLGHWWSDSNGGPHKLVPTNSMT